MNHLQKNLLKERARLDSIDPNARDQIDRSIPAKKRAGMVKGGANLVLACLILALLILGTPGGTRGQTAEQKDNAQKQPSATTNAPAQTAQSDSTNSATAGTNAASAGKESKPGDKSSSTNEIQLSFQGANVDMIAQWLAQNTGKSVVKHPRVQCQLTIVGSKKLTVREAVTLVYRALSLEGFTAIESSNSILIVPEGSEPKMSPEFLAASRTDVPEGRQRLVKIYPLKHVQAAEIKEKVKSVLTEKGTIDTDDRANQIIVTDYNDNLVLVGQLVNMLDSEKAQDVTMRVIPLKHVSAQDLVKEISPVYQKMNAKSPKDSVEVTANDRSNSLIVFSSEANFKAIQEVVAMLDTEEASEKILRAFPLKNAEAMDAAKQLQDLYQDQDASANRYGYYYGPSFGSSKNTKKMSVVADRRRNTLMVQASPGAMDGIAKMIEAIDEPITDDSLAPKIFPLKYVSAGDIEDLLNELFLKKQNQRTYWNPFGDGYESSSVDRDVGRLYGKVRITSEPHANAIILTSNSAENMAAVEAVIKQLDVPSEAGETTLRVGLNFAKAITVANSMNILFAKGGSPGLRQTPQPGQQGQTPLQQAAQAALAPSEFELGQDAKEDGYFPWLGGQPENTGRSTDGRATARPVSDLVGRVRVVADQRSNSLLISANVHFFPQVLKLIEELDAPTAQVLIEARIVEVASDFLEKLGVRWSPDGSKVFTADDFDNSVLLRTKGEYIKTFGGPVSAALANSLHSGIIDTTMNLDFLIQFLRKTTDATVLAQPQLNIADNELGKLFIGQQVPFIDRSLSTDVGGLNQSFSYKNVGIILDVTPHINTSGDVALRVRVEASAIVPGQTLFGGAILDTRNFKTDLTVKNGQTMVLGGIIQKQLSKTVRKVPFLGDIPGLKWLFRKNDDLTHEVELMVFLQPKIVRTPQEAKELLEQIDRRAPRIKEWFDQNQPPPPTQQKH